MPRLRTPELIAAGIGLVLLLVFIVLNAEEVEVDFLVATARLRLAWALLVSGALGFISGALLFRLWRK